MAPKAKPAATATAAAPTEEKPMLFKVKQGALPAREFFMEGTEIPIADIKGKIVENAKSFNGNITLERIILMKGEDVLPADHIFKRSTDGWKHELKLMLEGAKKKKAGAASADASSAGAVPVLKLKHPNHKENEPLFMTQLFP